MWYDCHMDNLRMYFAAVFAAAAMSATAAEVTGTFANADIPKKWKVNVFPNKVSIAYANGTYMLIR